MGCIHTIHWCTPCIHLRPLNITVSTQHFLKQHGVSSVPHIPPRTQPRRARWTSADAGRFALMYPVFCGFGWMGGGWCVFFGGYWTTRILSGKSWGSFYVLEKFQWKFMGSVYLCSDERGSKWLNGFWKTFCFFLGVPTVLKHPYTPYTPYIISIKYA